MAACACRRRVSTGQRERSIAVIERCRSPTVHRVTTETIVVEISGDVIRIGRAVEICQMTSKAVTRRSFELTVLVAIAAGDGSMSTQQRKRCG